MKEVNEKAEQFHKGLENRNLGIYKALAGFQQECPVIHKGAQGHNYSYADLPAIFEVINPLLAKHGLGFTQPLQGKDILTILFHVETGETIESLTEVPTDTGSRMNIFQSAGSGITYYRRYAISSMLGIVTDVDTDAAKQPLPNDRFEKALEGVKAGTIKKEQITKSFKLTAEQIQKLG
tara:strand:+ start:756 stop:1292 length:537 start_codon:yes stop_codon:yes gene_type:complete